MTDEGHPYRKRIERDLEVVEQFSARRPTIHELEESIGDLQEALNEGEFAIYTRHELTQKVTRFHQIARAIGVIGFDLETQATWLLGAITAVSIALTMKFLHPWGVWGPGIAFPAIWVCQRLRIYARRVTLSSEALARLTVGVEQYLRTLPTEIPTIAEIHVTQSVLQKRLSALEERIDRRPTGVRVEVEVAPVDKVESEAENSQSLHKKGEGK